MNILYVCTWNVFRSMSAEYLTKKYLEDHTIDDILVSSTWTKAHPEAPFSRTLERLSLYGCDATKHQQRKITPEILWEQDLIICMSEHHRQSVREMWFDAVLFNEIAYDKSEDLLDDTEYMNQHGPDFELDEYVRTIVDYIHEAIPFVIEHIRKI